MAEPLVYVLILNYRAWWETVACLEALTRCTYPNFRLLVLDNASDNDAVAQIRRAFPQQEILLLERNLGFAGGNNVGLRRALAEGAAYVWLLNPDTLPEPTALSALVEVAERTPRVGAVGAVLYEMEQPTRVQAWGGGQVVRPWGLIRLLSHPKQASRLDYISGACLLLSRAALEEVGLLDEGFFMYGEDADLGLRLRRAGFRLEVAPAARIRHRGAASWGSHRLAAEEHFAAANTRLLRKHAPWPLLAVGGYTLFWTLEYALRRRWASIKALGRGVWRGWRMPLDPPTPRTGG